MFFLFFFLFSFSFSFSFIFIFFLINFSFFFFSLPPKNIHRLATMPSSLSNLKKLKSIHLRHNLLDIVPVQWAKLENTLVELDLRYNYSYILYSFIISILIYHNNTLVELDLR